MLRELMDQSPLEETIDANEKRLNELLGKIDEIDRETTEMFTELEVTPDQVQKFLDNEENFTDEHRAEIRRQKEEIDAVSNREVRDIGKVRKAQKERGTIQNNWIFVR